MDCSELARLPTEIGQLTELRVVRVDTSLRSKLPKELVQILTLNGAL